MWSSCSTLLLFLPVHIRSICVDYSSKDGFCHDSSCFARTLYSAEGVVQKLGCLSHTSPKENLHCGEHLRENTTEICLESGSRQMCCCLSSNDTTCNSAWQLTTASPVISTESYFFLLLALLVTVALSFSYHQLLGNRLIQVTKEVKMQILWTERVMFTLKMVILLIFFAAAWIPTVPDCSEHSEGRIQPQMEFLFELIRPSAVGSTIFILPLAGLIYDFERIYRVYKDGIPTQYFSLTGLLSLFLSVTCSLIIYAYSFTERNREFLASSLCKKNTAALQMLIAACLLGIYASLLAINELLSWKQRRANENFLMLGIQEPRSQNIDIFLDDRGRISLDTAISATTIKEEEYIDFSPRPFALDSYGEGILVIRNRHVIHWVAVRMMCSIPWSYAIHPQKLVLPPQREVTVSIRHINSRNQCEKVMRPSLMIQWFSVGSSAPLVDATRLWQKPFSLPVSQWKFFVLPIFHEQ